MQPRLSDDLKIVVNGWPKNAQTHFHGLRDIVKDTAATNPLVGPLTETLKWGEPSFLTEQSRSGTTLRVAWKSKSPDEIGLFVICRTDMLEQVRALFPDAFRYEGTRAAYLPLSQTIPVEAVSYLASRAQTYHL